jgi:hypothetical protein
MDAIRLFPMVRPSGYPDKTDALERRVEKHHEEYRALLEQKKAQDKIQDIGFEIYTKKVVQERLRMEIFTNRKLDILV